MKIAFGYRMGAGKDEAVSYLLSSHGGTRVAFATPLYDIQEYAQRMCGFKIEKDRRFLQWVGTEWARNADADVWVRALLGSIPETGNVFLSDLRFYNEFAALKADGWTCVKLIHTSSLERVGTGSNGHRSEQELDSMPDTAWDHVIENNGTLEEFYDRLDILVSKINNES
jgi:hypothetical protein